MHALETAPSDAADVPQLRRFESLYRDEFAFVWSVAQHLGVPPGAIDDVVQDVFVTAYRRLDHLRFEVSPRAWLFGVTRRVAFRYRRGAARRARRHTAFAEVARRHADTPQQRHDDAQQLDRLLAQLSDVTRRVWQMTELLGMSAPEIASELGLPLNTVYSRLRLARAQLQAIVGEPARLDAWRDGARRRQDPPAEAQQRTWAVILPVLGDGGGAGVGLVAWVKSQAAMATTLIATGVVIVVLVVRDPPAAHAPGPAATSATPASAPRPAVDAPAIATPSSMLVADTEPAPAPPPPVERRLSPRTPPIQTALARARLAEEIALIDRVRAQLAADDTTAAMTTIAAHAQQFPDGVLVDVREAARVDAQCRGGDAAGAEATAQRLLVEHPASAVAQRFANFRCPR